MESRIGWGQTSAQMALLANVNRDPKKGRSYKPDDFNPFAVKRSKGMRLTVDTLRAAKKFFVKGKKRGG